MTRIGVCTRNQETFPNAEFEVYHEAKLQSFKVMSHATNDTFKRIATEHPDKEIVVRLWDRGLQDKYFNPGQGDKCSPDEYIAVHSKRLDLLFNIVPRHQIKVQIHNEPNHIHKYEGWGQEDEHAASFTQWYIRVFWGLKSRYPDVKFGFPGLAIPHRDDQWLAICKPAIRMSDFLGVHLYWQNLEPHHQNHVADFWGLRFKFYNKMYPDHNLYALEAGNSNIHAGNQYVNPGAIASEIREHISELSKYDYVKAVHYFICSSPSPEWEGFVWLKESGERNPVVWSVGNR